MNNFLLSRSQLLVTMSLPNYRQLLEDCLRYLISNSTDNQQSTFLREGNV